MAQTPIIDHALLVLARAHAKRTYEKFRGATARAVRLQQRILFDKLRRHADSAFGREHGFRHIRSIADFRRQIPLQDYDSLSPYIERMKNGDPTALLGPGERVLMFALTSGTTAEPKYIPVTDRFLAEYRAGWNAFGVKALMDHCGTFLRAIVQVSSPMDESWTPAGIPCGSISGLMASTQKALVRKYYAAPSVVAKIADATARYYVVARFAICRDVAFLITASPATQLKLARVADEERERIVRDVRDGTLCHELDIAPDIRRDLERRLRPRLDIARRLEDIIRRTGRLLPRDYWRLGFVANWIGGSMNLHLHDFPEYFGDTPVRDIGLLASEGRMSIPVEDGTPAGILDVTSHYYEFIPSNEIDAARPSVRSPHQLEVGREYFIVLTTSSGLCRYKIGDQIRVVDFVGEAPVIEFLNKGSHVSSITGEKLTERQAVLAVESAAGAMGVRIDSFVLAPQWGDPPYYVLHVEAGDHTLHGDAIVDAVDRHLRRINIEYDSKRKTHRLGPIALNVLPAGRFQEVDAALARRHRRLTDEQYKHQFLYNQPGQDALLTGTTPKATSEPAARRHVAVQPTTLQHVDARTM